MTEDRGDEDVSRIQRILEDYNKLSNARCNILFDVQGHPVVQVGTQTSIDIGTFGALVAGSFAATRAIAKLLGEEQFSLLSHQGKRDHIHLSLIADRCILTTVFDDATTIGTIRLYGQEAVKKLAAILGDDRGEGAGVPARLRPRPLGPGGAHAVPPNPDAPDS